MTDADPRIINPNPTIVHDVVSQETGETYRLFVSLPRDYATSTRAYPLMVIVDAQINFTICRNLIEINQVIDRMPELIIVGIGYPCATYMDTLALRGRDMTFIEYTAEEKAADSYPFDETGGGYRFLEALRTELLPYLESTYRVDSGNRALVGGSMGADFALYTLFNKPDLFHRIAAVSPYIEYREGGIPAAEEAYAAAHTSLPVRLIVAREGQSPMLRKFMETFKGRNYEGLELDFTLYEGEDHFSVGAIALTHALPKLYRQPPSET